MDAFQFFASLASSLAWPVFGLAVVLILRKPIGDLLGRVLEAEGWGMKAKFDPKKLEQSVGLAKAEAQASVTVAPAGVAQGTGAAHDASVRVRESLASSMAEAAEAFPAAAVLSAYAELQNALIDRMVEAKVAGTNDLSGDELIEVALRKRVVSPQTAVAFRGLLVLRNLVGHGGDVDVAKAREYLSLADAVVYAIETWRPGHQ